MPTIVWKSNIYLSFFLHCRRPRGHFGKLTARRALKNKENVIEWQWDCIQDDRLKQDRKQREQSWKLKL